MKLIHENMIWADTHSIKVFTENTKANKAKLAKKTPNILLGMIQYTHNYMQGLKRQSAYDAASILFSDINWFKKSDTNVFIDENNIKHTIELGKIYYIDFGNSFKGELSYFHYGLCIGKNNNKFLIIPIRSGNDIFDCSFHPTDNPNGKKCYRRGLQIEGFGKNCVLLLNDIKYISAGRIEKETGYVSDVVLKSIQEQAFSVEFPIIFKNFMQQQQRLSRYEETLKDKKFEISKLKQEINHLNQILDNKDH